MQLMYIVALSGRERSTHNDRSQMQFPEHNVTITTKTLSPQNTTARQQKEQKLEIDRQSGVRAVCNSAIIVLNNILCTGHVTHFTRVSCDTNHRWKGDKFFPKKVD